MRKFKPGFSLAEMLIALGIMAIIVTMSFAISTEGIERAYKKYVYTGYVGINSAFFSSLVEEDSGKVMLNHDKIVSLMNLNNNDKAPNGIQYTFSGTPTNSSDGKFSGYKISGNYTITMSVPKAKTKDNNSPSKTYTLTYMPNSYVGVLVPDSNLEDRKDLLLFKLDDSKCGRIVHYCKNGETGTVENEPCTRKEDFASMDASNDIVGKCKYGSFKDLKGLAVSGVRLKPIDPRKFY